MIALAWTAWAVALLAAERSLATASPVARMLALTAITFFAMKLVVLANTGANGMARLPVRRLLLFLAWPGMNPRLFERPRRPDRARARALARRGLRNAIGGALLVVFARAVGHAAAAPMLMVGLSLLVHFGLFTLFAAGLVAAGFRAGLPFDAPWRATTPDEFWTRRWNRGFAEMTSIAVQRPLAGRLGRRRALLGAFGISGLLHEVAISLPVGAGYGLPTLYFVLQGLAALALGPRPSRAWTLLAIVVPLPLVFHPWFVRGVVGPLLGQ
jgi:Membrane bound O-acyl transferase family